MRYIDFLQKANYVPWWQRTFHFSGTKGFLSKARIELSPIQNAYITVDLESGQKSFGHFDFKIHVHDLHLPDSLVSVHTVII